MYFTTTPEGNRMEALMKKPPGFVQRGGGRRRPYRFTKQDCDCRCCLHYHRKSCTVSECPFLEIRLECGAASFYEAVRAAFDGLPNTDIRLRLSQLYGKEKKNAMFQNNRHKNIFEMQRKLLRQPDNRALAVLYLLTADSALWNCCKRHLNERGKLNFAEIRLVALSADGYALWKAVKELQTGQRQISLCELADREAISDRAFRLITQAAAISHFGTAALGAFERDKEKNTDERL